MKAAYAGVVNYIEAYVTLLNMVIPPKVGEKFLGVLATVARRGSRRRRARAAAAAGDDPPPSSPASARRRGARRLRAPISSTKSAARAYPGCAADEVGRPVRRLLGRSRADPLGERRAPHALVLGLARRLPLGRDELLRLLAVHGVVDALLEREEVLRVRRRRRIGAGSRGSSRAGSGARGARTCAACSRRCRSTTSATTSASRARCRGSGRAPRRAHRHRLPAGERERVRAHEQRLVPAALGLEAERVALLRAFARHLLSLDDGGKGGATSASGPALRACVPASSGSFSVCGSRQWRFTRGSRSCRSRSRCTPPRTGTTAARHGSRSARTRARSSRASRA